MTAERPVRLRPRHLHPGPAPAGLPPASCTCRGVGWPPSHSWGSRDSRADRGLHPQDLAAVGSAGGRPRPRHAPRPLPVTGGGRLPASGRHLPSAKSASPPLEPERDPPPRPHCNLITALTTRLQSLGAPGRHVELREDRTSPGQKAGDAAEQTLRPGRRQRSPQQDGPTAAAGRAGHRPPGPWDRAPTLETLSLRPQRLPLGSRPRPAGLRTRQAASVGPSGRPSGETGGEGPGLALADRRGLTPKRQTLLPTVKWLFPSQVLLPGNPDRFARLPQCSNHPEHTRGAPDLARSTQEASTARISDKRQMGLSHTCAPRATHTER